MFASVNWNVYITSHPYHWWYILIYLDLCTLSAYMWITGSLLCFCHGNKVSPFLLEKVGDSFCRCFWLYFKYIYTFINYIYLGEPPGQFKFPWYIYNHIHAWFFFNWSKTFSQRSFYCQYFFVTTKNITFLWNIIYSWVDIIIVYTMYEPTSQL